MRKSLMALVVVFSMLVTFVGTAAAAPLTSGTTTLVSVEYIPGKGPVFTFSVNGEFSNSELNGSLHIEGGEDFDLHCSQVDSNTVKCTVSKKAAGKNVVLSWGGATFWTSVPVAPEYCYNVYDYDKSLTWKNYGTNCQEKAAQYGDSILWHNPDFNDNLSHIFLKDLPCAKLQGDAYYFPKCPLIK